MNPSQPLATPTLKLTVGEQLLLRLVLNQDIDAWREWAASQNIDEHSKIEFQLFPAVYKTLQRLDEAHPWKARLKGVYRQHWAKNQKSLAAYRAAAAVLPDCKAEYLQPFEQQVGERLGDNALLATPRIRLATKPGDAPRVISAFAKAGWTVQPVAATKTGRIARLRAGEWRLTHPAGEVWLTNFYHKTRRDSSTNALVWAHSSAHSSQAYMRCVNDDHLLYEALCDQPKNTSSIRWLIAAAAILSTQSEAGDRETVVIPSRHYAIMQQRAECLATFSGGKFSAASLLQHCAPDISDSDVVVRQITVYTRARQLKRQIGRWGGVRGTLAYLYHTRGKQA